jgi:hypothetical protein
MELLLSAYSSPAFLSGTFLIGLVAVAFTKANLSFLEIYSMRDQEAEAMMDMASCVLKDAHHGPRPNR